MNTPEGNLSFVSRIGKSFEKASHYVERFLLHMGGDFEWGGKEDEPRIATPRERLQDLLSTPNANAAIAVGTFLVGYVALSQIERSFLPSHDLLTQLIPAFFLTPGR